MEIRELKPKEHLQYIALRNTVFLSNERKDIRAMNENLWEHEAKDNYTRLGTFDVNGQLQSAVTVIPYTIRMNGNNVKMGGIASVASKPEVRGKGNIRNLMNAAFNHMNKRGQVFSFLSPFSHPYYRKFGYEICRAVHKVTIPINQLEPYPFPRHIESYEPGGSITPYEEIYENFIRKRNLAVVRDENAWKKILDRDPYKSLEFTYLHRCKNGRADAYILYSMEKNDSGKFDVVIKECCWTAPSALQGILGFLAKLGAEAENVRWSPPCDINIHALFPECYDLIQHLEPGGMCRLVNVPTALKTLRPPAGNGRVTIDIADTFWPVNSGVYTLEWESGNLSVKKSVSASPDMTTTVETLAQLVTGYLSPDEAHYRDCTTIRSGHIALKDLFPKQPLYLMESF